MGQRLLKSTAVVGGMTLLSRVLGFVRDVVMARTFGASSTFDAFLIAFKLPNFFRRLFGEGAFAQAFVPVLSDYRAKRDAVAAKAFIARIMGNLAVVLIILVAIVELFSPGVIWIFAPGFHRHPEQMHLASHLLRITFPYVFLICLTALAGAVLNSYQRFAIPAFTPVLLNLSFVAAAVWWAPHSAHPIHTIAWAVVIGGVAQLLLQVPSLRKIGLMSKPKVDWRDPGVRRVVGLMIPIFFGASVAQISLLIDNIFASYLPAGSISWLYYSDRFTYLPLGMIGVALSTVVLPHLSLKHAQKSTLEYAHALRWALRWVWLVGAPAALGLLSLAGPVLSTCLYRGAFNVHDLIMTQRALMMFSIGLPAFMCVKILTSAFYAQKNVRTPVRIAVVALIVNLLFNALLIRPFAHVGLAMSTVIAAWVNVVLLWWSSRKTLKAMLSDGEHKLISTGNFAFYARCAIANLLMAAVLNWHAPAINVWVMHALSWRIFHLVAAIAIGIAVYVVSLWVMGLRLKHLMVPDN